jgi:hypothetical protein
VLLAAAIFVLPPARGTDMSYAAIAQYAADNATLIRISGLLATLAMVSFVWFVGHLRHVLQRAEGGAEAFSPVVFGSGIVLAALSIISLVPFVVLAFVATSPGVLMSGELTRAMVGTRIFSGASVELLFGLFVGTAGAAMVRRELAGPWLGWIGLPVALIGLLAGVTTYLGVGFPVFTEIMAYLAFGTFVLWIAAASIVMLVRPEVERGRAPQPVFAH